jgi:hypothetical protein
MSIRATDISVALRLLSAGWSVLIVILIASSYGTEKALALAQFFYISLTAVVTSGFSSFTLSRFAPTHGFGVSLLAIAVSSLVAFLILEMSLIPVSISLMTFAVVATFLVREVLSFMARHREHFATAVIVRDHIWRATLSLALVCRTLSHSDMALEKLFLFATCTSTILELGFVLLLAHGRVPREDSSRHADTTAPALSVLLRIVRFDLLGKFQSLSIAAPSIFISSSEGYFESALVTMFILVERSSRPFGLIASQAILDFQNEGTGSRNLMTFLQRFIVNRKVHFIGGATLFVAVLAFFLAIYGIKAPVSALAVAILFHAYVPLFNISNTYVVLNAGWRFLATRIAITLAVIVILIFLLNVGFSAMLGIILVTMILQDALMLSWEQLGDKG